MKDFLMNGTALLLLVLQGCAHRPPIVPVPEAHFRTEVKREERLPLPLTPAARNRVEAFLAAGGNTDNIDRNGNVTTVSDPGAKMRSKELLDQLASAHPPTVEDLTGRRTYKKWFRGEVVYGVVDAREEAAPPESPIAVTDGRYWWVFYPHGHDLVGLMVVLPPVPARQKREAH